MDSITHCLYSCPRVQTFWENLCGWFERAVNIRLREITQKEFVFGVNSACNKGKIENYVVLQTKHFIHRQKLFHRGDLRLLHFLQELKRMLQCEKLISHWEGKLNRFKKWEPILSALG